MTWLGGPYPFLVVSAAAMSAINLYVLARLLPRTGGPPNLAQAILVGYILLGSAVFWIVLPWALLVPDLTTYYTVLTLMTLPMPAPFLWMMAALFRADERSIRAGSSGWALLVAGALVLNEVFMSVSFGVALAGYSGDAAAFAGTALNAIWFAGPMLATMALLLLLVPLSPFERRAFAGLAATVAVGPILLLSPLAGGVAMAALMTVVLSGLALGARGPRRLTPSEGRVASGVAVAFLAMAAAEVVSVAVPGSGPAALPYGAVSVVVMLGEGWALVRRGLAPVPRAETAPTPEPVPVAPSTPA